MSDTINAIGQILAVAGQHEQGFVIRIHTIGRKDVPLLKEMAYGLVLLVKKTS